MKLTLSITMALREKSLIIKYLEKPKKKIVSCFHKKIWEILLSFLVSKRHESHHNIKLCIFRNKRTSNFCVDLCCILLCSRMFGLLKSFLLKTENKHGNNFYVLVFLADLMGFLGMSFGRHHLISHRAIFLISHSSLR